MNFENWFQKDHPEIALPSAHAVLDLVKEGATVPFIARYRKERTANLNEVAIQVVIDAKERWDLILLRQGFILSEIERQEKLSPELKKQIETTFKLDLLEDLYLPYKQKRKTKAANAREAGLEPLADWIWNTAHALETPQPGQTLELWAFTFRNETKNILDAQAAIAGAQDILVERLSEMQALRQLVRSAVFEKGTLSTQKGKKAKENSKFENYFSYQESIQALLLPQNSHRYLAIRRGWNEEELRLSVEGSLDEPDFEASLIQAFEVEACGSVVDAPGVSVLKMAARLAFKVYVFSSIEAEVHKALRDVADQAAIQVFTENLRKLLLAAPLGSKSVLGIDPGLRTGCKLAIVDESGKYITSTVIHLQAEEEKEKAKNLLVKIIQAGGISAIAVGNGTAGRETEAFVRKILKEASIDVPVVMVSEAGASIYSASEIAREEFPELDLTVRGAISIARRLQDPLAELVKVEPKSIGVGQYQHDVAAQSLKRSLTQVVESCVNQVGVNLNTASLHLLSYVSGIGQTLAKSLVNYRQEKGLFSSRQDLLKVPKFSKKSFEQAAGFLRIPSSLNPLDNTGVHPEHYEALLEFAKSQGKELTSLTGSGTQLLRDHAAALQEKFGRLSFSDILKELEKPGRDPRSQFVPFSFREDIHQVKDLQIGMLCPGVVTNVTNFGAFVDIGVHQDGLVHISQLSRQFVKDPREVVSPGDHVRVKVLEVNGDKNQISLSIKAAFEKQELPQPSSNLSKQKPLVKKAFSPRPLQSPIIQKTRTNSFEKPIRINEASRRNPREVFNNPFGGLVSLREQLKTKNNKK